MTMTPSLSPVPSASPVDVLCLLTTICTLTDVTTFEFENQTLPNAACDDPPQSPPFEVLYLLNDVLPAHVNFTWTGLANAPGDATVRVLVESNCDLDWYAYAEGVGANSVVQTSSGSPAILTIDAVPFGGDWLAFSAWFNMTEGGVGSPLILCLPRITGVEIVHDDEELPCECPPDPATKPEVLGLCTPEPCDHPDAAAFFGEAYACICSNATDAPVFDGCGVCGGDGSTCPGVCCERRPQTTPLALPFSNWARWWRCDEETAVMPRPGQEFSVRSVQAKLALDAPPVIGLAGGEFSCDFTHNASSVHANFSAGCITLEGYVWCGFDSHATNNHGDDYEDHMFAHPYYLNFSYCAGVQYMPESDMIVVNETGIVGPGGVSEINCGTVASTIDPNIHPRFCAKANSAGTQLKVTNVTDNQFDEPGTFGFGWLMNMDCGAGVCPYCGLHEDVPDGYSSDEVDYHWCAPADIFFVLEAECVPPPTESASQSRSRSPSRSGSPSRSDSRSSSASPSRSDSRSSSASPSQSRSASPSRSDSRSDSHSTSHSKSESPSTSMSMSASMSTSLRPCCFADYLMPPEDRTCPGDIFDSVPPGDLPVCFDCVCNSLTFNYTDPVLIAAGLNPRANGCCDGTTLPVSSDCYRAAMVTDLLGCGDECCQVGLQSACEEQMEECGPLACCCDPWFPGCPDIPDECEAAVVAQDPACQLWFDTMGDTGSPTLNGMCTDAHAIDNSVVCCENKTMVIPEEEFCLPTASQSASASASTSCPPPELPPNLCPPAATQQEFEAYYHPDAYMCVCDSTQWGPCKLCGDQSDDCLCPCERTGAFCEPGTLPDGLLCLAGMAYTCDPYQHPTFIEEFVEYGLRNHWGWYFNSTFAGDRGKAEPGNGLTFGDTHVSFTWPEGRGMKLKLWDGNVHIYGHGWGGWDKPDNKDDTNIWDGLDQIQGLAIPREQPWMIEAQWTVGVAPDYSVITGTPNQVSLDHCVTVMPVLDWSDNITLCLVADADGVLFRLAPDFRGEDIHGGAISGWGTLHNLACDDRCDPRGLNKYRCGPAGIKFVLESECQRFESPSTSATPKMPCCERNKFITVPREPLFPFGDSSETASASQSASFPFVRRRGLPSTATPSAVPEPETQDLAICDWSLAADNLLPGMELQLRDHFLDRPWAGALLTEGPVQANMSREFMVAGNLYLTASDSDLTVVKLDYTPGQGVVHIHGHVMGRFLDPDTGMQMFPADHPLGPQLYHLEVTYTDHPDVSSDWHSDFKVFSGALRLPYSPGSYAFRVAERAAGVDMAMPVVCSNRSGGLFYPKARPDLVTRFNATDLTLYDGVNTVPPVQPMQFLIISAEFGGILSWTGHGLYANKNCSMNATTPDPDDIGAVYREQVCRQSHYLERGQVGLIFDVEGQCECDEEPLPTPGWCPEHGVVHDHWGPTPSLTPNAESLSHSQSPLASPTPSQTPCGDPPNMHGGIINDATFPPEVQDSPAVAYVEVPTRFTDPNPFVDQLYDDELDSMAVFVADEIASGQACVATTIVNIPYREFVYVKLWFENNVTDDGTLAAQQSFPANFRPLVGCGTATRIQCGAPQAVTPAPPMPPHHLSECWVPCPAKQVDLFICVAHQPAIVMPFDYYLSGAEWVSFEEDQCTAPYGRSFGIAISDPLDRIDEPGYGTPFWATIMIAGSVGGFVAISGIFVCRSQLRTTASRARDFLAGPGLPTSGAPPPALARPIPVRPNAAGGYSEDGPAGWGIANARRS